ncbi:MAG TPA: hypothetical protein VGF14_08190 [Alphaproteobacteria bacterium]
MARMTPRMSIKQSLAMGLIICGLTVEKCGRDAYHEHQKEKQKSAMTLYKKTLAEQVQPPVPYVRKAPVLGSR